ncbi:hypothetical protein RRSWK_04009 [Rhodopirellula sp. SWK7]|nr:hypothetical protein RRSWK_04009 [Rhodopirellula sp. SWK7]
MNRANETINDECFILISVKGIDGHHAWRGSTKSHQSLGSQTFRRHTVLRRLTNMLV